MSFLIGNWRQDENPANAARTSAAGEWLTEPLHTRRLGPVTGTTSEQTLYRLLRLFSKVRAYSRRCSSFSAAAAEVHSAELWCPYGEGADIDRRGGGNAYLPEYATNMQFVLPSSVTANAVPPSPEGKALVLPRRRGGCPRKGAGEV